MAESFSREKEGTHRRRKVDEKSCATPAGTSNELDVQNEWEENTHKGKETNFRGHKLPQNKVQKNKKQKTQRKSQHLRKNMKQVLKNKTKTKTG